MWNRLCLIFVLSTLVTASALAFDRPFAPHYKRGSMTPALHPQIIVDGVTRRLSPGARIWNQENLIQTPATIQGNELPINYTENDQGDIDRIWILTPDEARQPPAK